MYKILYQNNRARCDVFFRVLRDVLPLRNNIGSRPCCYTVCERLSRVAFRFVHAKASKVSKKIVKAFFHHLFFTRGRVPLKTMGILLTRKSGVCV